MQFPSSSFVWDFYRLRYSVSYETLLRIELFYSSFSLAACRCGRMPCCSCKSAGTCVRCACATAGERCTDCYPSRASKCSNSASAASLSQPHPRITRSQVAVVDFVGQNIPSSLPPLSSSSLPLLPSLSPSAKAHDLANDGSGAEQNSQRAEQNIQRSFPSQTNDSHLSLSLLPQNLRH